VINFLRQKITDRYFSSAEKQDYIRQLKELWFNVTKENIYQSEIPGRGFDFWWKEAFQRFKNNKSSSEMVQNQSHNVVTELMSKSSNDSQYRQVA
jgi:hypothetical protein